MIEIRIDKKSGRPLYVQIRDRICQAIDQGEISPGDKLPTVAAFAKDIGVTHATVRRALEDLKGRGLTRCHVGRGTFVAEAKPPGMTGDGPGHRPGPVRDNGVSAMAARQLRQRISKGLCDLMAAASQPGTIDFSKGFPDPSLMDPGLFKEMVSLAMKADENIYLPYGDLMGMPSLREIIAQRYADKGVHISADQVLITIGSQQGMSIAALDAAEKHRRVVIETPGFQGTVDAFAGHGNWVETLTFASAQDPSDQLKQTAQGKGSLLCICPEFGNPTGKDMEPAHQKKVADWARASRSIVLSDEIFQDLRVEGDPPESMFNLLGDEQTLVVSSLSKSLVPGLRLGWIIGSARRMAEYTRIKRLMAQTGPPLMQGVAKAFFTSGAYDDHLVKVRSIYKERRDAMISCLEQFMPAGVTWTRPRGGLYLWVSLPRGYSSVALLISLLDKGVSIVPGPAFDMDQGFVNAFRIGWAWTPVREIQRGMEILADAVKDLLIRPPGDAGLSGLGHF